jgi:hypothetical protein
MNSKDKIWVDGNQPAALIDGSTETNCATLGEAKSAWERLPPDRKNTAKIKCRKRVFTPDEIERLSDGGPYEAELVDSIDKSVHDSSRMDGPDDEEAKAQAREWAMSHKANRKAKLSLKRGGIGILYEDSDLSHDKGLRRITSWLNTHQAWFTAIAATFLAMASLWVGYQQMRIADTQERIAEAQALPAFEIGISQIKDDATGIYKTNELQVDCVEGRAFEFDGHAAYFLNFTAITKTPQIQRVSFRIPVNGYYDSSFVSSATKGRLLTALGHNNNERFNKLAQSLRQPGNSKFDAVDVEERTYFSLSYKDLLERRHSQFYEVFAIGGANRLKDSVGETIFSDWRASLPRMELDKITPDFVFGKLEEALSAKK